ncbi:MAG: DMT family transporter [Saprospiraceae bacterium]|nr:DMT family transporter [Saprospiraceae bacterium]
MLTRVDGKLNFRSWWFYALAAALLWGLWGALIEIPEKGGFPATLGYCVWAIVMLLPAVIVLRSIGWKLELDRKSIWYGCVIGFLGAAGQLVLFQALILGPAYVVFPLISLSPVVTIVLSIIFLKEKASLGSWIGIVLALLAVPLLSYQPAEGNDNGIFWILLSLLVFLAWGLQAYFMKLANHVMKAESIFFYMTLTGILLIPIAIFMTDFDQDITWGVSGPLLTAAIQLLNAVGALCLVYAFRYGKAIIVSPVTNAGAPVITVVLSLLIYSVMPHWIILGGMIIAIIAIVLMSANE